MPDSLQPEQSGAEGNSRAPISRGRVALLVILSLMLLLAAAAGGVAWYVRHGLQPTEEGPPIRIEIPSGTSAFGIADLLEEQGIIRDSFLFKYYMRYKDEGSRFKAGVYDLAPGMTRDEVIEVLNEGRTVAEETFRFTIPEGYTVRQIADKLASEGLVDADAFAALADAEATRSWSASAAGVPDDPNLAHRFEGYLFPETYEMKAGSDEAAILKRMMTELDRKLEELPEGWESVLEERGLTLHELLTIASLIEREVVVAEERPLVAGVIYNRLDKEMPLQIDATVQYALGKPKERLFEKDLEIDSPYNTYRIPGLPPGPIASPSLSAIRAALEPEPSDYLFYVTKKDGSQTHLFARTYDEHLRNIRISKDTAKEGGG